MNLEIRFYPVFRSIRNTDSSKFTFCPTPKQRQAALRSKTASTTSSSNDDEVDRPTLDSKLDAMAERIQVCDKIIQSGASYLSQDFVMFFHVSCKGLPGQ